MRVKADNSIQPPDISGCDAKCLAERLKALGHPARLEIIAKLRDLETPCCGEVCDCLPLAQSTVSQHLDILKRAGLIIARQEGTRSFYSLNSEAFESLSREIVRFGHGNTHP